MVEQILGLSIVQQPTNSPPLETHMGVLPREIYKMNPFGPGGHDSEPIRPQGTHFVSPASYLRSTFPKRTQCAWVLGLHVIS
jgi:hypothetical protein